LNHTPIIGPSGHIQNHADRIVNLENIHGKSGWHQQMVLKANYTRPLDLLIYKGSIVNFNSSINFSDNENVAQDFARYDILVFDDGLQNPAHLDYINNQIIISRIQNLNSNVLIFGIVPSTDTFSTFSVKVDQWNTLHVNGIFIDKSGYDFGTTRADFNERVDYIHNCSYCKIAFANSSKLSHILGTDNDPLYPNITFNSQLLQSNLVIDDWVLLDSFPIDTTKYVQGYEDASSWANRGVEMNTSRYIYNINVASFGTINNDNVHGDDLFSFGLVSALMWSLNAFGTSDTNYSSNSSSVKFWKRPNLSATGKIYSINPSVQWGVNNTYHRFSDNVHLILDFTTNNQTSYINTKWSQESGSATGLQGATGIQGVTGLQGEIGLDGLEGIQGETGLQGVTGSQGETGLPGINGSLSGVATLTSQLNVTNTTNETTILTYTAPANSLVAGSQFRFSFSGTHQNQATSGTLIFRIYIGTNAGQNITLGSGSARSQTYMEFSGVATIRTAGSSGTFISSGLYSIHTSATAMTKAYLTSFSTTTVNTTSSAVIRITAQWQTASSTNSLLIQNACIERIM